MSTTLPSGWEAIQDDNGDTYYYQASTETSQWEHPDPQAQAQSMAAANVPRTRKRTVDKGHGRGASTHIRFQSVLQPSESTTTTKSTVGLQHVQLNIHNTNNNTTPATTGASSTGGQKGEVKYEMPTTHYGTWASSMALFSISYLALFGTCSLILFATDDVRFPIQHYMLFMWALMVGVGVWLFETFWGYERKHHAIPKRAIAYLVLSLPFFATEFMALCGVCYVFIALASFMAWKNQEQYMDVRQQKNPIKQFLNRTNLSGYFGAQKLFDKLRRQYVLDIRKNEWGESVFMLLFFSLCMYLFWSTYVYWNGLIDTTPVADRLSRAAPFAKGFGVLLDLSCAILVIPMLRTFIRAMYDVSTRDQSTSTKCCRKALTLLPLHYNIDFHKFLAAMMISSAFGHTFFHFINYAQAPDNTIATFGVWPWISGMMLFLCMFFIFSSSKEEVRSEHFEIFWLNHHFFAVFYLLLLMHGQGFWNPNFWKWFVIPGSLYASERFARYCRSSQNIPVVQAVFMQDSVFSLEFAKTGPIANYKEGQYLFIQVPYVSKVEWHPFTISSAPSQKNVTLHIKTYGRESWTYKVRDLFKMMGKKNATVIDLFHNDAKGKQVRGKIRGPDGQNLIKIDGPHSAPTQHVGEFRNVMVCGAGIGVTPVAATLKEIVFHTWKHNVGVCYPGNAYFYWSCKHSMLDSFRWFILLIAQAAKEAAQQKRNSPASWDGRQFQVHIFVTSAPKNPEPVNPPPKEDISFWGMSHGSTQDGKVEQKNYCGFDEVQLYKDLKAPTKEGKSLGDGMVNIYSGRPKWGPRFEAVHTNHPDKNIGVTFCGHPMIANQLKLFSYEFNRKRPVKKFKFYKENF